jgi:putative FmdB family regulatory protein
MPAYSYRCSSCGDLFQKRFSFEDDSSVTACPLCGETAKKIYEAAPVHFKGRGWGGKP